MTYADYIIAVRGDTVYVTASGVVDPTNGREYLAPEVQQPLIDFVNSLGDYLTVVWHNAQPDWRKEEVQQ